MTILEPVLYANGALRLTRHGAGRGGNILVLERDDGTTDQVELPEDKLQDAVIQLNHMNGRVSGDILFGAIKRIYAP